MPDSFLNSARVIKGKFKLWNSELDRLRYASYYRNRLTPDKANLLLYNRLLEGSPFIAGKLGSVESRLVGEYRYRTGRVNRFTRKTRMQVHQNAGIFPVDDQSLVVAAEQLWTAVQNLDLLGCWPVEYQARLMSDMKTLPVRCEMPDLEPFHYTLPWSAALAGKRVLVLHPFVSSFLHQWKRRELLFPHSPILPDFKPIFLPSPVTTKGANHNFLSWHHALESTWNRIECTQFDVALIGCGAYSLPLALRIKTMGKPAIHLGGSLQLMFGVFGKRWEKFATQRSLVNKAWIRPLLSDRPINYQAVEDGCYW